MLENIPVHGDELKQKKDSDIRIFFENIDGLSVDPSAPAMNNNKKIKYLNALTAQLEIDVIGGAESRTNWPMLQPTHHLRQLLNIRDGGRTVVANNEHERFSVAQQGGTFLA